MSICSNIWIIWSSYLAPLWQVSAWLVSLEGVTKECQNSTLRGNKIVPISKPSGYHSSVKKKLAPPEKIGPSFMCMYLHVVLSHFDFLFLHFISNWNSVAFADRKSFVSTWDVMKNSCRKISRCPQNSESILLNEMKKSWLRLLGFRQFKSITWVS